LRPICRRPQDRHVSGPAGELSGRVAIRERRRRCWIASVFSAASACTRRARARRTSICSTRAPEAIEASKRNAAANGLAEKCSFDTVNVFDWLKAQTAVKPHERVIPRFDLIILDPPSFTRNRASVPDALRGYKEIHLRALKLLKPGGTLATFCCSHHVDARTCFRTRCCRRRTTRATFCAAWRPTRKARTIRSSR
jgi:16S rRNA G966 N2-methylase RsmD